MPDLTNVQVQVITEAPALSPVEVESLLSFPVEGAMSGLPNVEQIRSISKFGVSVVTIVFKEGTDIYRARQLVGERLSRAAEAIPPGYGTPMLGPIATALGEVFQFQVKATKESGITPDGAADAARLVHRLPVARVHGVTEINAHGGEMKTYRGRGRPRRAGDSAAVDDRRVQRAADPTTPTWAAATWSTRARPGTSAASARRAASRTSPRSSSTSATACP